MSAPAIQAFGTAFYNGMKTLTIPDKVFLKLIGNVLGYANQVKPLAGPVLALKELASGFHNAAALPGAIMNAADITSGVSAIADSISRDDASDALFHTGYTAARLTGLWSDVTDILSVVDSHITKVNGAVLNVFKKVGIVGLVFNSGWGIFENSFEIYKLSAGEVGVTLKVPSIDAALNPGVVNEVDVSDECKGKVVSAELNLRMWKLAEKISYMVLALVLTVATFTTLAVPVWLILVANTATLVFGVGKYFIEEMYVKPVTKNITVLI